MSGNVHKTLKQTAMAKIDLIDGFIYKLLVTNSFQNLFLLLPNYSHVFGMFRIFSVTFKVSSHAQIKSIHM